MSKSALAVLGLAAEQPKHGYEILQDIKERGMEYWVRISTASVYNTLARLEKQDYISETKLKVGNMPERKVYKLTSKGKRYLQRLVEQFIDQDSIPGYRFKLAVAFMHHIEPEKAERSLKKRLELLEKMLQRKTDDRDNKFKDIPFNWMALLQNGIDHIAAEIRQINYILNHMPNS